MPNPWLYTSLCACACIIYTLLSIQWSEHSLLYANRHLNRPVVIVGPNKDRVIDGLVMECGGVYRACIPHTTRPPRDDEVNAHDYFFVSEQAMHDLIAKGMVLFGIICNIWDSHLLTFPLLRSFLCNRHVCWGSDVPITHIRHLHQLHPRRRVKRKYGAVLL